MKKGAGDARLHKGVCASGDARPKNTCCNDRLADGGIRYLHWKKFSFHRNSTVLEVFWLLGMEGVAALDTRRCVYAKHCAWHEDGRLLADGDSGLDASSKRFIGEQQLQVKHMEHSIMQWKTRNARWGTPKAIALMKNPSLGVHIET